MDEVGVFGVRKIKQICNHVGVLKTNRIFVVSHH